jgi:hypothetical protein
MEITFLLPILSLYPLHTSLVSLLSLGSRDEARKNILGAEQKCYNNLALL